MRSSKVSPMAFSGSRRCPAIAEQLLPSLQGFHNLKRLAGRGEVEHNTLPVFGPPHLPLGGLGNAADTDICIAEFESMRGRLQVRHIGSASERPS